MDSKITLSFDKDVIIKAKEYAEANNISLSRLAEYLLRKVTSSNYASLEDLPVSSWVHTVSEGQTEYQIKSKSRKKLKEDFFNSRK